MGFQEPYVEVHAVTDDRVASNELGESVPYLRERWSAADVLGRYASVALNELRDFATRIDEGLESVQHLVAPKAHRPDFQDCIALGFESRGFEVYGDASLFQRRQTAITAQAAWPMNRGHHTPNPPSASSGLFAAGTREFSMGTPTVRGASVIKEKRNQAE